MTLMQMLTLLAPLAFIVGFALQRGNVCTVLAARQIVWAGRWSRLRGLLLASAWGFAVLMPLVWYGIGPFSLSKQAAPGLLTILAGMVYALGCAINGACIFGVCSRVTAGHISFIFAIPAMAVGAIVGQFSGLAPAKAEMLPTMADTPSPLLLVLWAAATFWVLWAAIRLITSHARAGISFTDLLIQPRWRPALAAAVIGTLGALLFATGTAWFYPAAAKRLTMFALGYSGTFPLDSLVGGGMLFVGGMAAALFKGRVLVRPPHLIPSIQAIIGGLVIGFAWALIRGGNDAMVLYLLPSLALHGIAAYASMLLTLIGIEYAKKRRAAA